MTLVCLIPAAGASSRMRGRDKLMELVDGAPLLSVMVARVRPLLDRVIVTVPSLDHPRAGVVGEAEVIAVPEAHEGMSASLRRGALAAQGSAIMVLPGDMPDLGADELQSIISGFHHDPHAIIQATSANGIPGHPVIFPADLIAGFAELRGDAGAKPILLAHAGRIRRVALPGDHAVTDLDTPEAWAAWRARQLASPKE